MKGCGSPRGVPGATLRNVAEAGQRVGTRNQVAPVPGPFTSRSKVSARAGSAPARTRANIKTGLRIGMRGLRKADGTLSGVGSK